MTTHRAPRVLRSFHVDETDLLGKPKSPISGVMERPDLTTTDSGGSGSSGGDSQGDIPSTSLDYSTSNTTPFSSSFDTRVPSNNFTPVPRTRSGSGGTNSNPRRLGETPVNSAT